MIWDLEEKVEDGFVALLKSKLPAKYKVYAAWGAENLQYPAVIVACTMTGQTAEAASFEDNRTATVDVSILTEAVAEKDQDGFVVATIRERNRTARGEVMEVLCTRDLKDNLNAAKSPGVLFGMAQLNATSRSIDSERRLLVTSAAVDVIACPTEK